MRGKLSARRPRFETLEPRMMLTGIPYGAHPQDTAEYLLGDVLVTVVLMESNGVKAPNTEDWTQNTIDAVKVKVQEGMQWWEDTLSNYGDWLDEPTPTPVHSLNFTFDFQYADQPVDTDYEPIAGVSNNYVYWVEDFLAYAGFATPASQDVDILNFNDFQRNSHGTDWAFTVFVVNDENDLDGRFETGGDFQRAFGFSGGRFFVSPAGRPASTFAHETGHIFYARDEYEHSVGSYTDHRGYYNSQNWNAWDNELPGFVQEPSLMASDSLLDAAYLAKISSESSLAMIGWQDSDGDGVFDVLDVPLTLTGNGFYNPATGLYRFIGHSSVQTLPNLNPSGRQNDITINEVSVAEYSLNDGATWQTAGEYHAYQADLDLKIPMSPGERILIRTRSVDAGTGLTVVTSDTTFEGSTDLPTFATDSGVQGYVWEDVNADGVWNPGERGIPGWNLELVDDQGQPLQLRQVLEPDDYDEGVPIGDVLDGVTLSAVGYLSANDSVGPIPASTASTGTSVFGFIVFGSVANWSSEWTTGVDLRIDFDEPTAAISIDAVGGNQEGYGRLEAYDAAGNLLERYTSGPLQNGTYETMTIERDAADVSYAIVKAHMRSSIRLDDLRVGPLAAMTTDKYGYYALGQLPSGSYHVKANPSEGWSVSTLSSEIQQVVILSDGSLQWTDGEERPSDFIGTLTNGETPWKNPRNPLDVDDDDIVVPLDALLIINELNVVGSHDLLPPSIDDSPPPYFDVSGDNVVSALDALMVINYLNSDKAAGNGESDGGLLSGGGGAAEGERDGLGTSLRASLETESSDQTVLTSDAARADTAQLFVGTASPRPAWADATAFRTKRADLTRQPLEGSKVNDALQGLWADNPWAGREDVGRDRPSPAREALSFGHVADPPQRQHDHPISIDARAHTWQQTGRGQLWDNWERTIHLIARQAAQDEAPDQTLPE